MIPTDTRFAEIQARLVPLWHSLSNLNADAQTIVVVPSFSLPLPADLYSIVAAYEERSLFLLFLLRQPSARMVFCSSRAIDPRVVDYYLSLLPGVIPSHARARLHLVSADEDTRPVPLSRKLLDSSSLRARIQSLVPDRNRAHIVPYITSELERDLVLALDLPMYGADPALAVLGTKSGARRLFAEVGVPHARGIEGVRDLDDVVEAIAKLRARQEHLEEVIVKLDEGVGGFGNGAVDLRGLAADARANDIAARVRAMDLPEGTIEEYLEFLGKQGGVVEERLAGAEIRSPSVQLRGTPLGELEVLSTHDQLLGGPSGQSYFGCRFPADPAYAAPITRDARAIGELLVRAGVLGRFAIDFVVVRTPQNGWSSYAIEVNLRKGGTTHPYLTLQFLTDGRYLADDATFLTPSGMRKAFVASDHVENEAYRDFDLDRLFDVVVHNGLHFDQSRQTGIVMHMMSALPEIGRFGITAVADSPDAADGLYRRALATFEAEASGGTRAERAEG